MAELIVYSTSWCPDCTNLKRFLSAEGIAFREIDIDAEPKAAEELIEATGKRGIPYMRIEDEWLKGYPLDAGGFRRQLAERGFGK